ncbi:MAG TPA: transglycosylase SLT domain-containing protein [Longimicrobiales bacterium]|nr:transglycosylase SLT domain-containing protein [Longimicrobiales bacterium]
MRSRHTVTLLLFLAVAAVPALLSPRGGKANIDAQRGSANEVPQEVVDALRRGRYWRASRILHQHLSAARDTSPRTLLLVAQADAGWGDWSSVHRLLANRPWLDSISGGYGWKLLGRSLLEQGEWEQGGAALSHYLQAAEGADEREVALTELRRAQALQEAGRTAPALAVYDSAAAHLPGLGNWIGLWAAEAAAQAGDTAETRSRLAAIDPDLAAARGWRVSIDAALAADDRAGALRHAERSAGYLESASERATAWRIAGDVRLEEGDVAGARAAWTRAIEASIASEAAVDAARQLAAQSGLSAADRLRIGRVFIRHGNRARGIPALESYLSSASVAAGTRDEVELELGRALFAVGRYTDVARRMSALGGRAASDRIASEALYLAARAQYRAGDREAALATLRRTSDAWPAQPAAVRANFLTADLAHDVGDIATARAFYHRAIQSGPDINESGHSMMRLAGIEYQQGDHLGAERIFDDYLAKYPTGRRAQQAAYWSGKAKLESGRADEGRALLARAAAMDPLSWYGLRAAELIDRPLEAIHLEPAPETSQELRAEVAAAMARVDLLRELGRSDAASLEVERLKRHFAQRDGALYLIAEALNARGMTIAGIRLGWEIHEQEGAWNRRLLRIIYPFPYRELILAEAPEKGLDPYLVAGLIRQESMFDAAIASGAGARGLMQIMPQTGASLARSAGIRGFSTAMLTKPEINIHLGTTYFAEMLDRFDGRVGPALAGYNAGPHRVQRWSSFPEYPDDELFMERIPYDETRDYLKKVQQNARIYRFLYPDAGTEQPPS